jgi:nitroimidazol reductase NimA-like FMN-containing flavoprotein (pyridoxamine 5'-phosphate oxidase superfamily)
MAGTTRDQLRAKEHSPSPRSVKKEILRRSFCAVATADANGAPHVTGVNYAFVGGEFYFATGEDSKKVRNIRQNPRVAVFIAVRKFPMGPPFYPVPGCGHNHFAR